MKSILLSSAAAVVVTMAVGAQSLPLPVPPSASGTIQALHIKAENGFEYDLPAGVAIWRGNVAADDPQMTLSCQVLKVRFARASATNAPPAAPTPAARPLPVTNAPAILMASPVGGRIEIIEAEGKVIIFNKKDQTRARGERAHYTAATDTLVLTGNPEVDTPQGSARGERIIYDRSRGRFIVEGKMEGEVKAPLPNTNPPAPKP